MCLLQSVRACWFHPEPMMIVTDEVTVIPPTHTSDTNSLAVAPVQNRPSNDKPGGENNDTCVRRGDAPPDAMKDKQGQLRNADGLIDVFVIAGPCT
ncbi:unnamed protein product [Boreogadus saida]